MSTQPISSSSLQESEFVFTTDDTNPKRVKRIYLELVNFTITIHRSQDDSGDGDDGTNNPRTSSAISVTDPDEVQSILDQASNFNSSLSSSVSSSSSAAASREGEELKSNSSTEQQQVVIVEISLDPLNNIHRFQMPA